MIEKVRDSIYRIVYKGQEISFKLLDIKESDHMWIIGSEQRGKELHIEFETTNEETTDMQYCANLLNALKEASKENEFSVVFGRFILEIIFKLNERVTIRFSGNNVRAELESSDGKTRIAETSFYADGMSVLDELDRLFLKLGEDTENLWICSDFEDEW